MSWKISSKGQIPRPRRKKTGFTLVELLAVVAIMVLMLAFVGPAVTGIKGGRDVISNAYGIAGVLEQARTYAMANNTYTWVGFFEEDGSKPTLSGTVTSQPGIGRVVVAAYASRDGSRYNTKASTSLVQGGNTNGLVVIGPVKKFESTHISSSDEGALGPTVGNSAYQVLTMTSPGPTVNYPLAATKPTYTFSKLIEFNPQGEASRVGDSLDTAPQEWLGIGVQPTMGATIDPKYKDRSAAVAILIEGLTGRVHLFKP